MSSERLNRLCKTLLVSVCIFILIIGIIFYLSHKHTDNKSNADNQLETKKQEVESEIINDTIRANEHSQNIKLEKAKIDKLNAELKKINERSNTKSLTIKADKNETLHDLCLRLCEEKNTAGFPCAKGFCDKYR